jgi:DNA-binding XRE family transcriptional regulator
MSAVRVCPERDIECGDNQEHWCSACPRHPPKSAKVEIVDVQLSELVKVMRMSKNMRQAELAKLCGLERTSITNIEGGKQRLMFETLQKIADGCGFELVLTIKRKSPAEPMPAANRGAGNG